MMENFKMKREIYSSRSLLNIVFLLLCGLLSVLRIIVGNTVHYQVLSKATLDDRLLIQYSSLSDHLNMYASDRLVKDMAFPKFLEFNRYLGWNFGFTISFLWILVAVFSIIIFKRINNNRWLNLFIFAFFLFFPSAFDISVGVRTYRNLVIVPSQFLLIFSLLGLFFTIFIDKTKNRLKLAAWSLFLAFNLFFSYYLKEDGLWILLLTASVILLCIIAVIVQATKQLLSKRVVKTMLIKMGLGIFLLCVPIIFFSAGTSYYKAQNLKNFGVAEINTRTEGEVGTFLGLIYKIDAPGRNSIVWAPSSAIQKAINVSPTLKKDSKFSQRLKNFKGGPVYKGSIAGDFLSWGIKDAWINSKGQWNEKRGQEYFKKVNSELKEAFKQGKLQKAKNRIQISSSMGGYTMDEIVPLFTTTNAVVRNDVMFFGYSYNYQKSEQGGEAFTKLVNDTMHLNIFANGNQSRSSIDLINRIIGIYQILAPFIFILAIFGILMAIAEMFFRTLAYKEMLFGLVAIVLFLGGVGVSFAISWFVNFLEVIGKMGYGTGSATLFYGVEATGLLYIAEFIGLALFLKFIVKPLRKKVRTADTN